MNRQDNDVCSTCFSSIKFPGTIIEQNGKCNRCNSDDFEKDIKNQTFSNISELRSITDKLKKKNTGKYDCFIGASGGLDSSYMIYIAKKLLNLNPLVVKYHSGFCHEISDNNLQTICKNLKVDFEIIRSKKQNDYNYIKFIVLALRNMGLYWGICRFCHYASLAVVYNAALKNNILLHLEAVNKYEKDSIPKRFKLKIVFNHLSKMNLAGWIKTIFYLLLAKYYFLKLKLDLFVPPFRNLFKARPQKPKKIKVLQISDYIKWDNPYEIAKILEKETGWKTSHKEMPMRFDCKIEDSFFNYTYKKATGNTTHTILCNNLIYGKIKKKKELKDFVEYHDNILDECIKEMMYSLKIIKY